MVSDPRASVRADRLRPLNAPRPILVEADERGKPVRIVRSPMSLDRRGHRWGSRPSPQPLRQAQDRPSPQRGEEVSEILDRWRIDDEWWRKEISRMYFQVLLEGGQLLTIFHDLIEEGWYEQITAVAVRKGEPVAVVAPDAVAGSADIRKSGVSVRRTGSA
jgi:hypothetical protein